MSDFTWAKWARWATTAVARVDRRSCIDDDARPSPTRSVGEEKVSETVSRPPCDQFGELGRRQGIWPSGSAESSRTGTMVCRELLEVRQLALGMSELVDPDRDRLIDARPTRAKRTPVRLFDADGEQVQVQQPTAVLPGDLSAANQDGAPEPGTVQPLSDLFVVLPNVRFLKVSGFIGRKAQGCDLVRTNILGSDPRQLFLLPSAFARARRWRRRFARVVVRECIAQSLERGSMRGNASARCACHSRVRRLPGSQCLAKATPEAGVRAGAEIDAA